MIVGTREALTSASGRSGIRGLIELLIANDWVCLKQPTGVVLIFPKPPHTLLERVCCGTSSLCSARHRWNVPKFITLYHLVKSGMLLHSFHLERWNVSWNKQAKSFNVFEHIIIFKTDTYADYGFFNRSTSFWPYGVSSYLLLRNFLISLSCTKSSRSRCIVDFCASPFSLTKPQSKHLSETD